MTGIEQIADLGRPVRHWSRVGFFEQLVEIGEEMHRDNVTMSEIGLWSGESTARPGRYITGATWTATTWAKASRFVEAVEHLADKRESERLEVSVVAAWSSGSLVKITVTVAGRD